MFSCPHLQLYILLLSLVRDDALAQALTFTQLSGPTSKQLQLVHIFNLQRKWIAFGNENMAQLDTQIDWNSTEHLLACSSVPQARGTFCKTFWREPEHTAVCGLHVDLSTSNRMEYNSPSSSQEETYICRHKQISTCRVHTWAQDGPYQICRARHVRRGWNSLAHENLRSSSTPIRASSSPNIRNHPEKLQLRHWGGGPEIKCGLNSCHQERSNVWCHLWCIHMFDAETML